MAYTKPGIEIEQEQRSSTPVLPSPELDSCIIGIGYHWQDPNWENPNNSNRNSVYSQKYDGSSMTVAASGVNDEYHDIVDGSVVVDLVGTKGPNTGTLTHLIPEEDFSVSNNEITVSGGAGPYEEDNEEKAQVRVGFLSYNEDINGNMERLVGGDDLQETIGEPVSWNPLAFGADLAMQNSGSETWVFGLSDKSGQEISHSDAQEELKLHDVYALSVLDEAPETGAYGTHVSNMSSPTGKKERIAFVNEEFTYSEDNAADAGGIRDRNSAYQNKRLFSTHPYSGYIMESRHISTIKPSYLNSVFSGEAGNKKAKFISDTTIGNTRYKSGTEITEDVYTKLLDNNWGGSDGVVTVHAPVPGYYYTAALAGYTVGKEPQEPLTNVPISGFEMTEGSQDKFIKDDLNTIASGGTWIMTQSNPQSPLVTRHQLSTDVTSIAKQELSITNALDYTAKTIREAVEPYIGRFNITPRFLKLINSIIVSISKRLKRNGIIEDITDINISQDQNQKDTVHVSLNVNVKFPVNFIKVKLVF